MLESTDIASNNAQAECDIEKAIYAFEKTGKLSQSILEIRLLGSFVNLTAFDFNSSHFHVCRSWICAIRDYVSSDLCVLGSTSFIMYGFDVLFPIFAFGVIICFYDRMFCKKNMRKLI